jgi:uncharacterized lipoprotein YehR (DUF1307 family)
MKKLTLTVIIPLIMIISLMATGCTKDEKSGNIVEDTFKFAYKGVDVTPGKEFKSESIDEEASFFELESCAFEGNDKVYTYENMEITASAMNGKDTVYSIYFLNDAVETTEGVKIADEKAKMIEKYGEKYEHINNKYTYVKGNVALSFIVENDVITSIEYTYNTDNK